jgi:hypothetical protein
MSENSIEFKNLNFATGLNFEALKEKSTRDNVQLRKNNRGNFLIEKRRKLLSVQSRTLTDPSDPNVIVVEMLNVGEDMERLRTLSEYLKTEVISNLEEQRYRLTDSNIVNLIRFLSSSDEKIVSDVSEVYLRLAYAKSKPAINLLVNYVELVIANAKVASHDMFDQYVWIISELHEQNSMVSLRVAQSGYCDLLISRLHEQNAELIAWGLRSFFCSEKGDPICLHEEY